MKTRSCFLLLVAVCFLMSAVSAHASIIYVKTDGNDANNGTSWTLAKATIGAALNAASSGDYVYVKYGTYSLSTAVPSGVKLWGGFAGTDSTRDWNTYVTTISSGSITATVTSGSSAIDGFWITGLSDIDLTGDVTFSHNVVTGCNSCADTRIITCTGPAKVVNNLFYHNHGNYKEETGTTFIYCASSQGDPLLINNTIYSNGVYEGITIECSGSPHLSNNIITNNHSGGIQDSAGTSVLSHNCVYGHGLGNYSGYPSHPTDINVNPVYVNASTGDFHLQSSSPCKSAGDNDEIDDDDIPGFAKTMDLDNKTRTIGDVEIGAYERPALHVSPDGDETDGETWDTAYANIDDALAVAESGDEVWVEADTYSISSAIPTNLKLFGGFNGTETSRDTRNWAANITTISGGSITATVTSGSSAVDGFVLTGLSGIYLTGDVTFSHNKVIDCDNTSPVISCTGVVKLVNNLIYDNDGYETKGESTNTIECASSSGDATIVNNTITNNGYTDGGGGAAIYCTGTPTIANNIITSQAGNGIQDASAGTPVVSHNCVYGNPLANYQGFPINWQPDNDINVDPEFRDPSNDDYKLDRDSVCEEMGSNSYIDANSGLPAFARTLSFWHMMRIATTVDIGADESWD